MIRSSLFPLAAVAALLIAGLSSAATIEIQLSGIDVVYDSGTALITDDGAPTDDIQGIFFFVDGTSVGSLLSPPDDLTFDLSVPGVPAIAVGGDTVTSAPGGTLTIGDPGALLDLDLDEVIVVYDPTTISGTTFNFVFAGTVGGIASQALPFGLEIGDPVTVSLSTQASDLSDDGTVLLGFDASGTGELFGALVPEPSAVVLFAMGAVATACRRRRR